MIIPVTKFNKQRNNFDLDVELEQDMIEEEIKEFWDADTVAERLDALVDTEYVWIGTKIKYSYNGCGIPENTKTFVEDSLKLMYDYLQDELGEYFWGCLSKANKIVCQANELKGTELDEKGKVIKTKEYKEAIDATKRIALMIEEVTKPNEY